MHVHSLCPVVSEELDQVIIVSIIPLVVSGAPCGSPWFEGHCMPDCKLHILWRALHASKSGHTRAWQHSSCRACLQVMQVAAHNLVIAYCRPVLEAKCASSAARMVPYENTKRKTKEGFSYKVKITFVFLSWSRAHRLQLMQKLWGQAGTTCMTSSSGARQA